VELTRDRKMSDDQSRLKSGKNDEIRMTKAARDFHFRGNKCPRSDCGARDPRRDSRRDPAFRARIFLAGNDFCAVETHVWESNKPPRPCIGIAGFGKSGNNSEWLAQTSRRL
jgi:hypothetical protein